MNKTVICLSLILCLFSTLNAQEHNEKVTVVAPYKPVLIDATKIELMPNTIDSNFRRKKFTYDIFSRKVISIFELETIKAAKVAGEPLETLKPFLIRLGMGNYSSPYAEFFATNLRSKRWLLSAHAMHKSAFGTFSGYEKRHDKLNTQADFRAHYYGKSFELRTAFEYQNRIASAFGSTFPDSLKALELGIDNRALNRFQYDRLRLNVGLSDLHLGPDHWHYQADIQVQYLLSKLNSDEYAIHLDGNINKSFKLRQQHQMGIDYIVDVAQRPELTGDGVAWHLSLNPYVKLDWAPFEMKASLLIAPYQNPGRTHILPTPQIDLKFNIIPRILSLSLGYGGQVNFNTLDQIALYNPYLSIDSGDIRHRQDINAYFGIHSALGRNLDFEFKAQWIHYTNLMSFKPAGQQRYYAFTPSYIDLNAARVEAALNYHLYDRLSISAQARYTYYDRDVDYLPAFEAALKARYNIQDKIILKTELLVHSNVSAKDLYGYQHSLKGPIDWGLGAEYRFGKGFSAFVEFNNLLNLRRYTFYDYSSYRMNFLIGLSYAF